MSVKTALLKVVMPIVVGASLGTLSATVAHAAPTSCEQLVCDGGSGNCDLWYEINTNCAEVATGCRTSICNVD